MRPNLLLLLFLGLTAFTSLVSGQNAPGDSIKINEEFIGIYLGSDTSWTVYVQLNRDISSKERDVLDSIMKLHWPTYKVSTNVKYAPNPNPAQLAGRALYQAGAEQAKSLRLRLFSGALGVTAALIFPNNPEISVLSGIVAISMQVGALVAEHKANRLLRDAGATLQ
jgi:hypothetical protein